MDSVQRFKINNWQEILSLVKIEYYEFFKEFHDYMEYIQNMIVYGFLDSENFLPSPLFKKRKEEIYFEILKELKERDDYSSLEYWINADVNDYEKFCTYVINLEDKSLACLLIFEKVYNPEKKKRLDYYRYRKHLSEYDWYAPPIPFINKKKTCSSCGSKYSLYMEKYSDTRKDIVLRECPNCNYTPSSLKYNLSIGVGISSEDKFIHVYFRGAGSYVEPKDPMKYEKPPLININELIQKREDFKVRILKIISENLIKEEVSLNWDEPDKYEKWFQFDKENQILNEDSRVLLSFLKGYPDIQKKNIADIAKKFIQSNDIYKSSIPFVQVINYDIVDVDLLTSLITDNLILFKLEDKTIEKLSKPFSLRDWTFSSLIPYQIFPNDIRVPAEYEILVNDYFIKNFEESKNTKSKSNFSNNTLSKSIEGKPVTFERSNKPEIRRLSVNLHKNPIYDNNRRPLFKGIQSVKKDIIIRANTPYNYNVWKQNDGSLTFTFVPVDEIVESKKISYCDLDEDIQNTLMEFESAMNDEQSREDYFNIDDDIPEDPFSKDEDEDEDEDDEEVPF